MLVWFAETTIVAGILAALAIGAGRLKRIPPSARHALWLVVLIKLLTPPLVAWPWAMDWRSLEWPADWNHARGAVVAVTEVPPSIVPAFAPCEPLFLPPSCDANDSVAAGSDDDTPAFELASTETVVAIDEPPADSTVNAPADALSSAAAAPVASRWPSLPGSASLSRGLLFAWLGLSAVIAIGQACRIVRFRRRLRGASRAPDFLVDEAVRIGLWLGVDVPDLHVVDDLGTPLLWCLGRPKLLLPTRLVKTLPLERWRGILTHELAHLRRRDQWVCRLELVAGLIWWWNPLYWLTRARLDAEAELACDAWVVWALPKDRLTYAEVLFDICSNLLPAKPMAPALSVAGSGRFFERRLTMILHNHVPCRLSPLGFLGACLLVLVALPAWSMARVASSNQDVDTPSLTAAPDPTDAINMLDDDDDDEKAPKGRAKNDADDDEDEDNDADDDDADDDDDDNNAKALERARAKVKEIEAKLEAKRAKGKDKAKKAKKPGSEGDASKDEKELESKLGPGSDFEKQIEELGEKIGKELEEKFGPNFEKQMEKLGKEIEAKFGDGSDFAKKMEAFGKEIEGKFGDGSDFAKKMEAFGKEMEKKFGDGSDFAKKMEAFGKEMEKKFGPGSEFEQKMKKLGEEMKEKYGPDSEFAKKVKEKASEAKAKAKDTVKAGAGARNRQISALEAQVAKLMEQIEALKAQGDGEKDDD
jgi:beta-lactamase regulating signal transducer with metallopeptidase domain